MNQKKVLFFNAKRQKCDSTSPHLGLAMLAAVLKEKGHDVLVVDYQFKHDAPSPETFVRWFKPDVIGVTLYTATMKEAYKIIEDVLKFDIPIIGGGPHATLYHDELAAEGKLNYIVVGEAENEINEIVQNAKLYFKSQIVEATLPDPKDLPYPDFTSFFEYEDISQYPLSTSRGCPYNCNFCVVRIVSSRKWRSRKPEECVAELIEAKKKLPNLKSVCIYDDNPMVEGKHIKKFLENYYIREIDLPLTIINTHANLLDEEIIVLLKRVRCPSIGLGVEHGNPEIFRQIGKGETLEEIERAAKLIKKHKISLCACFIIGLPGDSFEKTKDSIDFAKRLKPDHIYWNMITPFKGSRVREWYDEHGKVYSVINHSSWVDGDFMCDEPCAETPEFSTEERKKAYLTAIMETNDGRIRLRDIPRLFAFVVTCGLYKDIFFWLPRRIKRSFVVAIFLMRHGIEVYRENGANEFIRKVICYFQKR